MAIDISKKTQLGAVTIVGGQLKETVLWSLEARARRVLPGEHKFDGATPGSHGLRSTWIRAMPRGLKDIGSGKDLAYLDPVVEEAFVSARRTNQEVDFEIAGAALKGSLRGEQLAELSAQLPHPLAYPRGIDVPPYVLEQGALRLEDGALGGLFEGRQTISGPVFLEPGGVVFTLDIPGMDLQGGLTGAARAPDIRTIVKLQDTGGGKLVLELLDDAQSSDGAAQWCDWLAKLGEVLAASRRTAWLRSDLFLGRARTKEARAEQLPRLPHARDR
ncbi:hypothetical protein WKW77_24875 [Variovorax ureilyticus]|uniref:Uncharacterized protein n=1 Tax=Variovorax ureilyticus TaxID=1836198 RepID=A0ABU8VMX4_9BURK